MRNYYAALELTPTASTHDIEESLVASQAADPEMVEEATPILSDPERRETYDYLHAQFSAYAQAMPNLVSSKILDTNHWDQRLIEFSDD